MTEHFQFAQPEWLYVLPFILCLIILRRRRGAEGSITYPTVRFISSLARNPQSLAGKIGAICFVLAAAALALALARPQKVEDKTFRTVNGIDIMIAFDLSYSMETPDMVLNRMSSPNSSTAVRTTASASWALPGKPNPSVRSRWTTPWSTASSGTSILA